jgi:hypothetical protein
MKRQNQQSHDDETILVSIPPSTTPPLHMGDGDHPSAFHAYQHHHQTMSTSTRPHKRPRHHHQQRNNRKRVSFASRIVPQQQEQFTIFPLPSMMDDDEQLSSDGREGAPPLFHTLTEDDCLRLWYQKSETVAAKEYVRALVNNPGDNVDDLVGLSKFTRIERSYHKRSAIWYVLAAHRESPYNHDFVRQVSNRCTEWARSVAEQEGFANYCEVYGDPFDSLMFNMEDNSNGMEEELKALNNNSSSSTASDDDDELDPIRFTPVDFATTTAGEDERTIPSVTPPHSPRIAAA